MAIGKEHLRFFEDIEDKQTQIWKDSADIGVEVTNNPKLLEEARYHIKELLSLSGNLGSFSKWGDWTKDRSYGSNTSTFWAVEIDDGEVNGYRINVDYFVSNGRRFLSAYITYESVDIDKFNNRNKS